MNYGELFHQKTKDHDSGKDCPIPHDREEWPLAWKTVEYKTYQRYKTIELPTPEILNYSQDLLLERRTCRNFQKNRPLSLAEVSNLLAFSCGTNKFQDENGASRRVQPSGGARYPLEVYLLNLQAGELPRSFFHYQVANHSLVSLWPVDSLTNPVEEAFTYDWCWDASAALLITAIPDRTTRKYGDRGYRYLYLETGIVVGNVIQAALANQLETAVMGGIADYDIEDMLGIDGYNETFVTGVMIGR